MEHSREPHQSRDPARDHDPKALRNALGAFATGVTIITTRRESGEPVGLTANSFSSVSLTPPLVLWSLSRRSQSLAVFESCTHFAINVLAADQRALSQRFATPTADKFSGVDWTPGAGGAPLLVGAAAHLICESFSRLDGGDHVIFLGHIASFHAWDDRAPLIFWRGRYLTPEVEPRSGADK